jgi:MYXO-CTERM domain-containing protein
LLSISGVLAISADEAHPFTINLTSKTLGNLAGEADGFDPTVSYTFLLATAADGITGFNPAAFTLNTSAFTNPFTGAWSIAANGDSLSLIYTGGSAIPEPSTCAAWLGAAALALSAARRRRSARGAG